MSKIRIPSRDPVPLNMKKPLPVIVHDWTFYASHFTTNFLSSDETISKGFKIYLMKSSNSPNLSTGDAINTKHLHRQHGRVRGPTL